MKKNISLALKLFLFLLFSEFAALMVTISFSVIFQKVSPVAYTFSQTFSLVILVVTVWQCTYMPGFKDSNMVRTGHMQEDIWRGFKIGALSQIPFVLFFAAAVIFNFNYSVYIVVNSVYWSFLTMFSGSDGTAEVCMRDLGAIKLICIALFTVIVPAIAGGVYIMGYKGIDLHTKLFYKKREK